MKLTSIAPLAIIIASPVFASNGEITAEFRESAPKDSFIISNTGGCAFTGSVTIDLAESAGKLLFDTTASGQGVEVFQPFELVKGKQFLTNSPKITDGDTKIMLRLNELAVGSKVSFTIDVDDTLENSALGQIRVSNSEIAGASLTVAQSDLFDARFDESARVQTATQVCNNI